MLALGAFVETRPDWIKNWSEPARVAILGVGTLPFIGAFVLLFWLLGNDLYSDEGFWLPIITFVIWLLYGIVAAIAGACGQRRKLYNETRRARRYETRATTSSIS